jgi:hypothetical protein
MWPCEEEEHERAEEEAPADERERWKDHDRVLDHDERGAEDESGAREADVGKGSAAHPGKVSGDGGVPFGRMHDPEETDDIVLSLRDRMPEYLAVFAVGFAVSAVVGLLVGLLKHGSLWSAMGYTVMLLGIVMMLAGGASGGGYTHLGAGAVGAALGGRRTDEDDSGSQAGTGQDPMDRLRKGLRPEANPRAFWQVIGGILYIALGAVIVTLAA